MNCKDIEYLINPIMLDKLNKIKKKNNNKDARFYKKRILHLIKNLLNDKEENINNMLLESYENFINNAIYHFKMVDTKDILQKEYEVINKTNKTYKNDTILNQQQVLDNANELVVNGNQYNKAITIPQCFPIKQNKTAVITPYKKKVNLKDPVLKTKGI